MLISGACHDPTGPVQVIGETWDAFPELKTQALKQIYKLAVSAVLQVKPLPESLSKSHESVSRGGGYALDVAGRK